MSESAERSGASGAPASDAVGVPAGAKPLGVLNVNADVMACRIAAALQPADLVIAGATAGVHDAAGRTIAELTVDDLEAIVADGTASAGMVAKLAACRSALEAGVPSVRIIDGRALDASARIDAAPGTTMHAGQGTLP